MRNLIAAVLAALCLATSAQAQTDTPTPTNTPTATRTPTQLVDSFYSFEAQNFLSSIFFTGASTVTLTNPSAFSTVGTSLAAEAGNAHLLLTGPSGAAAYMEETITASDTADRFTYFQIDSPLPTTGTTRRVFEMRNSTTSKTTCFVNVEVLSQAFKTYQLSLWYEDTGNECTAASNDGTECTTVASCDSNSTINGVEAACVDSRYGSSFAMVADTTYRYAVEEINGFNGFPGAVKCALWIGKPGETMRQYASSFHAQGACKVGSTDAGDACYSDADCDVVPVSGNCETPDVVQVNRLRQGLLDAGTGAFNMRFDNITTGRGPLSSLRDVRLELLYPLADGGITTGWTKSTCGAGDFGACIDEMFGGQPDDGDTTYMWSDSASRERSFTLQWAPPTAIGASPTPTPGGAMPTPGTGERILGLAPWVHAAESVQTSSSKEVFTDAFNGALCSRHSPDPGTTNFDAITANSTYYSGAYSFSNNNGTGGVSCGVGWTYNDVAAAEIVIGRPSTSPAGVVRVSGALVEVPISRTIPTPVRPLSDRAHGGVSDGKVAVELTGDSRQNFGQMGSKMAADLAGSVDNLIQCAQGGTTQGNMIDNIVATAAGTNGYYCALTDVKIGSLGVRADYLFFDIGFNDWAGFFVEQKREGYCYDNGGADQGHDCYSVLDSPISSTEYRCSSFVSGGSGSFLSPCLGISGACGIGWDILCLPGTLQRENCRNGLCVRKHSLPRFFRRDQEQLFDYLQSRNVMVILVLPNFAYPEGPSTPSVVAREANAEIMAQRAFYRAQATKRGWAWVDLQAAFQSSCTPWYKCLNAGDAIHPSTAVQDGNPPGVEVMADIYTACVFGTIAPPLGDCSALTM